MIYSAVRLHSCLRLLCSLSNFLIQYLGMLGVCTPQIWTGPCTKVGLIAFGLMDPPPAQVPLKINVERS